MVLRRTDLCCLVELGKAGHEVLEAVLRHNELGQDCHVSVRTLHQDRLGFESLFIACRQKDLLVEGRTYFEVIPTFNS